MMYFDSLAAAWNMAGHGPYVWSAYGISFVVIAYLVIAPWRRARTLRRQIDAELRRSAMIEINRSEHAPKA